MQNRTFITLVVLIVAAFVTPGNFRADDVRNTPDDRAAADFAEVYRANLEQNLRWILARERAASHTNRADRDSVGPRVGILADAGVWHLGARSLAESLELAGVSCRVLDRIMIVPDRLNELAAVVLPGGWAPYQLGALDQAAQSSLKQFVESGGRCVGVCAGAYLVSRSVRWEGQTYPYPLALFDGTAEGPIPGLALWPERGPVELSPTAEGREQGLAGIEKQTFYYSGGSCFVGGKGVTTLACYPNGASAVVRVPFGKGDVVLTGVHFERPAPTDAGDDAPPPKSSGTILKALVIRKPAS